MKLNPEPGTLRRADYKGTPSHRPGRNKNAGRTEAIRNRPFIAYDGEGYTTDDGEHYYGLFGSSLGNTVTGKSLTYHQCFPILFKSPKEANHVIFSGSYDVTMMFKGSPYATAILTGKWVKVGRRYSVRYLRYKMLTVKDHRLNETRTLYDVFTYFQGSFVKACLEYIPPEVADGRIGPVGMMKEVRNKFFEINSTVKEYMNQELELLVILCDILRERLAAVNIHPAKWHGPGAISQAVLKREKVNDFRRTDLPEALVNAGDSAYYGGRFEMFKRGVYKGPVYQYDIRSAYPAAMLHLPSLLTEWDHFKGGLQVEQDYALYYVKEPQLPAYWCPPYRSSKGYTYFPEWAYGWYWGIELPRGTPASQAWIPRKVEGNPFAFVQAMYDERAQLKREGKPEQLALKLALNSLYGKLAQSQGANWSGKGMGWAKPRYHETLWAGYITAYTRRQIRDAVEQAGDNVIAVETDSVFSTVPLDLELGDGLGQWELDVHDGIKYIQSGISMVRDEGKWSYKTRGLNSFGMNKPEKFWNTLLEYGYVVVEQTRFGNDPRMDGYGRWITQRRRLALDDPQALEKRINTGHCEYCLCVDIPKLVRGKKRKRYLPTRTVNYSTHLHPLQVNPIIEFSESSPYSFVWTDPNETMDSDVHSINLFEVPVELLQPRKVDQ